MVRSRKTGIQIRWEDNSGVFNVDIGLPKTLSKVDFVSFIIVGLIDY